eukprot:COSAG02_NODE_9952_length_2066_cov_1.398577_2_plen_195_part_00
MDAAPSEMVVTPPCWDVAKAMAVPERWFVLFAIVTVFTCEWIDRSLMIVAMEPVKVELGLTDTQLGAAESAGAYATCRHSRGCRAVLSLPPHVVGASGKPTSVLLKIWIVWDILLCDAVLYQSYNLLSSSWCCCSCGRLKVRFRAATITVWWHSRSVGTEPGLRSLPVPRLFGTSDCGQVWLRRQANRCLRAAG